MEAFVVRIDDPDGYHDESICDSQSRAELCAIDLMRQWLCGSSLEEVYSVEFADRFNELETSKRYQDLIDEWNDTSSAEITIYAKQLQRD